MIEKLWTTSDYTEKGKFQTITSATLVPKPVQNPHPPIYIAATRTQATLDYAVSKGFPTMVGLTLDTPASLDLCHRYEALSAKAGLQTKPTLQLSDVSATALELPLFVVDN